MIKNLGLLIFFLFIHKITPKSFTQCQFADELHFKHNFTVQETKDLICIAQKLSGLNTNVFAESSNGSLYGIFQINQNFCSEGNRKGDLCTFVECDALLNEDINDDVMCVKKILNERGLNAWNFNKQYKCRKMLSNFNKRCLEPKLNKCEYARKIRFSQKISEMDAYFRACIYENEYMESTLSSYEKCHEIEHEEVIKCFKDNKLFTTSTEISIVYDDDQEIVSKNNAMKCDLAESIFYSEYGNINFDMIAKLVCIAEHESYLNISLITSHHSGVKKYGIFQIDNDKYCNTNKEINICDVLCEHLNDDELNDDIECANHIYKKEGLSYWPSEKYCSSVNADYLRFCNIDKIYTTTHRSFTTRPNNKKSSTTLLSTLTSQNDINISTKTDENFNFCEFIKALSEKKISIDDFSSYACIASKYCKSLTALECADELFSKDLDLNHKCHLNYNSRILQCIENEEIEVNPYYTSVYEIYTTLSSHIKTEEN